MIPLKSPKKVWLVESHNVPSNLPMIRQWWSPWPTGPGRFWAPWVAAAGRRSGTWARCGRSGNQGISHQDDQQREDRPTEVWMMTWWWHEPWDLPTNYLVNCRVSFTRYCPLGGSSTDRNWWITLVSKSPNWAYPTYKSLLTAVTNQFLSGMILQVEGDNPLSVGFANKMGI